MSGKRIGYVRVSTGDQNPERQLEGISLDKKYTDYASAKNTDRPQLQLMLDFIREDDTLIVHSMDRLARNLRDMKELVDNLVAKGIKVQFIKENLIFSGKENALSNLMLHLMGAFSEFEYSIIRERQAEGIRIARSHRKYKGRVKKLKAEHIQIIKEWMETRKSKLKLAKHLGITRTTLYRYLKNLDIKQKTEQELWDEA